ncbi:hypothetical protein Vadar_008524 [Vaccinium darrowii]|uniref:Uncharacterized protein n=1 Tax=Vaccinium darrowii TaxID=229202 RepID=A0ACB7Z2I8_9ERIC|nr:hypothetical protein Vadar_008524 [Vaccinium darrowii]
MRLVNCLGAFFTCKTLVVLKIHGKFVFNVPHYVCLPNLKTLGLNSLIYLDDELMRKFLSGCPALDAPNLEYLDFCDSVSDYICVGGMPSVVEDRVDINKSFEEGDWREHADYGNLASGLLRSISNVRRLSITGYTLRCLSCCNPNLPTFRNLIYLELGFDPFNGPVLLLDFLQSSPKLEVLVFPKGLMVLGERMYVVSRDIFFEYHWSPPERVPECLLLSLETIEIHRFCGDEKEELDLVKYLLKNGMVLEKMTILCHYWFGGDNSFSFKDELENYPRGSTNCNFTLCIPYLVPISSSSSS